MKQYDIYLVSFDPSVGNEYQKVRPAVLVQSDTIKSTLISVMPLSSKVKKRGKDDVFLKKNEYNRLFEDSILRVQHISSFSKERFIRKIGEIDISVVSDIQGYLKLHFGL